MSQIPTKARQVVRERSNDQCSRCGVPGSEIHHRQRRREGGHGYENLVLLCGTDHRWVHAHPSAARDAGYIIPISVSDISAVPIKTFAGWVVFGEDGGITGTTAP